MSQSNVPPTGLLVAVNRSEWRRNSRRRRHDPSGVISLGGGGLLASDKEALERRHVYPFAAWLRR
jgi:hypothetical protein